MALHGTPAFFQDSSISCIGQWGPQVLYSAFAFACYFWLALDPADAGVDRHSIGWE
uniref:Uncharacterized protein n=1 Tax=Setaria italica TaxID=4555 RepID=K4AHW7_SETIT